MMNIYFPDVKGNPEELRGRVMFYNAPKTVIDICSAVLMRDDCGDEEEPEAYGVFFDENAGFVFELQVLKQGRQNSYKTSKFRATKKPMIALENGQPDFAKLTSLLAMRHDLFSKIETPDSEKIKRLFEVMVNGDDSGGSGFDSNENSDKPAPVQQKVKTEGKEVVTVSSKNTTVAKKTPAPADDEEAPAPVKKKPVAEDEDVVIKKPKKVAEPLAGEGPDEEVVAPVKKKLPDVEQPSSGPTPIDDLMSQLDDED